VERVIILYDSNILIDFLNGLPAAITELSQTHNTMFISIISWTEILAGVSPQSHEETTQFLRTFKLATINIAVATAAAQLRQQQRLKIADALIYASALSVGAVLATRNSRDFPQGTPHVHIPYHV
jgi:predicted nucleic acid-binding protein